VANRLWQLVPIAFGMLALASCNGNQNSDNEHVESLGDFSQAEKPANALGLGNVDSTSEEDVDGKIDQVLGDHKAYRAVFDDLRAAIAANDKLRVANLIDYPIAVSIDGNKTVFKNSGEFVKGYDQFMTPDILGAIRSTSYASVMVSYEGMMLGNGQVWISGICKDDACEDVDVKVVTLQSAPVQ
jgi:hypothetical protein